ncbi:endo alpha-1,4 polygalactosaminidase [Acidovorax sp. 1608163]|uniref:endo alpha-1,4 polygalactosaminidase n=1 Tax=Acidovorax sp. 1608163 TaxID=2478662 RepID=UPI001F0991E6|nr:endo alpha-1,4 polygalactosaminidase [Acidovorax sp. 1608163]
MIWSLRGFLLLTLSLASLWVADEASAKTRPAIALHYGHNAPLEDLKVFDIVVVEPDHGYDPIAQRAKGSELYAYTSVAEVQPSRSYFKDIPAVWQLARNGHWNSVVLDQTPAPWPSFFADRVIAPLWQRGYRGFFLDTMDSYRLASHFDEAAQQAGLVRVIQTLHERFPGIRLIMNRGFDIVPRVKDKIEMVAAESLYRSWNAGANRYEEVPDADRQWLLTQLRTIQTRDGIPVLAIDYVPPNDRALARETAKRIQADGFTPWVSDSRLDTVGIGAVELVPRRILILYNGAEAPAVNYTSAHRFLQMPLNHMGYVVDYADVRQPLPKDIYRDRYVGVVTAFNGYMPSALRREFSTWLQTLKNQGMPLAIVGDFGLAPDKSWADMFGIQGTSLSIYPPLQSQKQHPMMGLEAASPLWKRTPLQPAW